MVSSIIANNHRMKKQKLHVPVPSNNRTNICPSRDNSTTTDEIRSESKSLFNLSVTISYYRMYMYRSLQDCQLVNCSMKQELTFCVLRLETGSEEEHTPKGLDISHCSSYLD